MPGTEELSGREQMFGAKVVVLDKGGQAGSSYEYADRSSDNDQMAREVPRHLTSTLALLPASLCEGTVLRLWGDTGRASRAGCR